MLTIYPVHGSPNLHVHLGTARTDDSTQASIVVIDQPRLDHRM